jgi:hypothetical protein
MLLEIQQLLAAEDLAPVKKKDVPPFAEIIGQGNGSPLDRAERQRWKIVARIKDLAVAMRH